MDNVVYYSPDGMVLASSSPPGKVNIDVELKNYAPGVRALRVDSAEEPAGKILKVVNGVLVKVDDMDWIIKKNKHEKDRREGLAELKKSGITDDQLKALFGG